MLDALTFALRLSSTVLYEGYLPADASGDYVYQLLDACSLFMTLWLLHRVLVRERSLYDDMADSFPVARAALICVILGVILHADNNEKILFDIFWMASVFTGTVSVVPQLWLMMKTGGRMKALTSHHIMALALSRVLSAVYMWVCKDEFAPDTFFIPDFNHSTWAILAAHVIHLLLLADFTYYYVRSCMRNGLCGPLVIPREAIVV